MKLLPLTCIGGNKNFQSFSLLFSLLLVSCDPSRPLIIENGVSKEVVFPCGSAEIYGVTGLGLEYHVSFYVEAVDSVFIAMDSLNIFNRENLVKYQYTMSQPSQDTIMSETIINAGEKRIIRLSIDKYSVNYGDTLLIKSTGFISCKNKGTPFLGLTKVVLMGIPPPLGVEKNKRCH